jgi:hypothetical protein
VEEGKLGLVDINTYLKNGNSHFDSISKGKKITTLLNHTAGLSIGGFKAMQRRKITNDNRNS